MKKLVLFLFLTFGIAVLWASPRRLTIVTLNDTHSHIHPWRNPESGRFYGGAARWASVLEEVRAEGVPMLFLHAGDLIVGSDSNYLSSGSPDWNRLPAYGFRGLADVEAFNLLGLDAACIGNHELDYGLPWLQRLARDAKFPLVSANLAIKAVPPTDAYEKGPVHRPYAMFERGGLRIAVVGLTTGQYIKSSQVRIADPVKAAQDVLERIEGTYDVAILLSHLGKDEDLALASKVAGFDVVVGGHSHSLIAEPIFSGGAMITQTRAYGEFMGRIDLVWEDGKVAEKRYSLIPLGESVPENAALKEFLEKKKTVGTLAEAAEGDRGAQSPLGKLVSASIFKALGCGAVMTTSAKYEGRLPKGVLRAQDFFSVFWPYRPRSSGPEKDLNAAQVMDIVEGRAAQLAKKLLPSADGLAALVRGKLPSSTVEAIAKANETLKGRAEYLQIGVADGALSGPECVTVMDIAAWRFLREEGLLSSGTQFEAVGIEIFEAVLAALPN